MSIRLKRLQADYNRIAETFPSEGKIIISNTAGDPPEKYQIEYLVNSLVMKPDGKVQVKNSHMVEIYLTRSYPRQAPQCRMLTPVFHPNIAPHAICIGDHWAAGESLAQLLIRIGEMLAFQSYNLKSPLNGEAARWAEQNKARLPIDKFDFSSIIEKSDKILSRNQVENIRTEQSVKCCNCGKIIPGNKSVVCASSHVVCAGCAITCAICGKQLCLQCIVNRCSYCNRLVCSQCHFKCGGCKLDICASHVTHCHICNTPSCPDCFVECSVCGRPACIEHIKQSSDGVYRCTRCLNL